MRTRTGSRQNTSRLTGLFLFLTFFFSFFCGFEFVLSGAVPFHICVREGSAVWRVGLLLHQPPPPRLSPSLRSSDFDVYTSKQSVGNTELRSKLCIRIHI